MNILPCEKQVMGGGSGHLAAGMIPVMPEIILCKNHNEDTLIHNDHYFSSWGHCHCHYKFTCILFIYNDHFNYHYVMSVTII